MILTVGGRSWNIEEHSNFGKDEENAFLRKKIK